MVSLRHRRSRLATWARSVTPKLGAGLALLVLLLYVGSCGGGSGTPTNGTPGPGAMDVSRVKTADWRSHIDETVEVEGYLLLNGDGTGVVLRDLADLSLNTIIPEERYLAVTLGRTQGLDPETYDLARVRLTGRVRATTDDGRTQLGALLGDLALCEVDVVDAPTLIQGRTIARPSFVNPCSLSPGLCDLTPVSAPEKYAILYSGGINKDKAYKRYWNDMVLYYAMLTFLFGYDPDNIVVVYKNGVPENGYMPVHQAATPMGLNAAFNALRPNIDSNDTFFFFTTNHGGTVADAGSPAPADEDFGADTIDECGFYYNRSDLPYDDDIAALVNSLSFGRMCCVMEQCYSGGMIYDLRGPNRVICTACTEVEVSYGGSEYDDFVMLFASALIGIHQTTSSPVDADENNDGKVSIYEAFRWATANDPRGETPQYEDSGEGIPIAVPSAGVTTDGTYGSTFFL